MRLAIKGNYVVEAELEYSIEHSEWRVQTSENLRVPHRFPWVVVTAVGRDKYLKAALEDAAIEHVKAVEERKRQEGLA